MLKQSNNVVRALLSELLSLHCEVVTKYMFNHKLISNLYKITIMLKTKLNVQGCKCNAQRRKKC